MASVPSRNPVIYRPDRKKAKKAISIAAAFGVTMTLTGSAMGWSAIHGTAARSVSLVLGAKAAVVLLVGVLLLFGAVILYDDLKRDWPRLILALDGIKQESRSPRWAGWKS